GVTRHARVAAFPPCCLAALRPRRERKSLRSREIVVLEAPMAWWSRTQGLAEQPKKSVPKGIWTKCERCGQTLYEADLDANFRVCTSCQHHFRMPTEARIEMIVDPGSWQEHDRDLESGDPLGFRVDGKRYVDQIKGTTRKVGRGDAYRPGTAA